MKRFASSSFSSLCVMATAYFMLADSNPDQRACVAPDDGETANYLVDGCGFKDDWLISRSRRACTSSVTVEPKNGPVPPFFVSFSGDRFSEGWSSASKSYDQSCTATKTGATGLLVHCVGPGKATCDMTMTLATEPADVGNDAGDAGDGGR